MRIGLVLVALLLGPSVALAQEEPPQNETASFESEVEAGKSAYHSGDYGRAAEAFQRAYALRPSPSLLYNIARAHDAAGELERAEEYYARFIEAPGISQSSRADAVARLKTIRDIRRMQAEKEAPKEEVKAAKTEDVAEPKPPAPQPVEPKQPQRKSASPVSWVLIGTGGASLVGSVVTGLMSQAAHDELTDLGYPDAVAAADAQTAQDKRRSGRTLQIVSATLAGTGAALVAGGLVTYFVTKRAASDSKSVRVAPQIGAHSAGVALSAQW